MARRGRPTTPFSLTDVERAELERYVRRRKSAQQLVQRARIVLECAKGQSNKVVAEKLRVTEATVCKWRGRFVRSRIDGLRDEQRPGAPRTISDEKVEDVVVATLEERPPNATHWSTRSMAERAGLRTCQETSRSPHDDRW